MDIFNIKCRETQTKDAQVKGHCQIQPSSKAQGHRISKKNGVYLPKNKKRSQLRDTK